MLSRGIRNNNPGNIRHSATPFRGEVVPSQDAEFKEFESVEWGFRAMFLIIHNYGELYGIDTLDKIIARWAPSVENDTAQYIGVVARRLGCSSRSHIDSLDHDTMVKLVAAMAHIECGVAPEAEVVEGGMGVVCGGLLRLCWVLLGLCWVFAGTLLGLAGSCWVLLGCPSLSQ